MIRGTPKELNITDLVDAAFREAAKQVIALARRTGTPVVVWKDGRVVEVPVDQAEAEMLKSKKQANRG